MRIDDQERIKEIAIETEPVSSDAESPPIARVIVRNVHYGPNIEASFFEIEHCRGEGELAVSHHITRQYSDIIWLIEVATD